MDGCTDGVDGVHYFDCQPNKGYFCLLEQLVPDQRFMASSKALNNCKLCVFATNPPPPHPPHPLDFFCSFRTLRLYARELDLYIQPSLAYNKKQLLKANGWHELMPLGFVNVAEP